MNEPSSKIPVRFYQCSRAKFEQSIRDKRPCDRWLASWAIVDPHRTPLAISYDNQIQGQIESEIANAIASCEQQRLVSQPQSTGLSILVCSKLAGSSAGGAASDTNVPSKAKLTVAFAPGSPDSPCSALPRELFVEAIGFNAQTYGGANGNMAWTLQNPQPPQSDPYFDLYGRTMRFLGPAGNQYLGQLLLTINKVVDLSMQFAEHPIPASVSARVDTHQPFNFNI